MRFFFFLILLNPVFCLSQSSIERTIKPFTRLDVSEGIQVEMKKGPSNLIIIQTDNIDPEDVITRNSGRTLEIKIDDSWFSSFKRKKVKISLEFEEIDKLEVSSAGSIISNAVIEGDYLEIDGSSAGQIFARVNVKNLDIDLSSSASVELAGSVSYQEVEVSSAASLNGFKLKSKETVVRANSAGTAKISVTEVLEAEANSAGSIRYTGNPDKIYTDSNSGGSIKRR